MSEFTPPMTVEQTIGKKLEDFRDSTAACLRDSETCIRREPLKSMGYALVAGYILRLLPVGAIFQALIRLLLSSLRPLALLYGAAKMYDLCKCSKTDCHVESDTV